MGAVNQVLQCGEIIVLFDKSVVTHIYLAQIIIFKMSKYMQLVSHASITTLKRVSDCLRLADIFSSVVIQIIRIRHLF